MTEPLSREEIEHWRSHGLRPFTERWLATVDERDDSLKQMARARDGWKSECERLMGEKDERDDVLRDLVNICVRQRMETGTGDTSYDCKDCKDEWDDGQDGHAPDCPVGRAEALVGGE